MNNLGKIKVLVVGDIMLDKYVIGEVNRISPEAPVAVVDVKKEYCTLGGCGNVAKNLASLGIQTYCVAACGAGTEKDKLINIMISKNIEPHMVNCRDRVTTIKERIISGDRSTQLLRIDRETISHIPSEKIITEIKHVIETNLFIPNIILVSDYCKGVITFELMQYIIKTADRINAKIIIDPKPQNLLIYKKAFAITPNKQEYDKMKVDLKKIDGFDYIVVTAGADGVYVMAKKSDKKNSIYLPAEPVEVFNVTGAGDSFVAVFSACVGFGMDVVQASRVANKCAAYVVTKPGTSAVPFAIFKNSILSIYPKGYFNGKEYLFD